MKIVKITWRDSAIYNYQSDTNYPYQVSIFESVGFLLKENKREHIKKSIHKIRV